MRILHIEDTPIVIRLIERIAAQEGYELRTATTGQSALLLLDETPDLILADLGLPDMDGLDLIQRIRERAPSVPIVAVTAFSRTEDRERCMAMGCTEYVTKPFRYVEMIELLRRYALRPVCYNKDICRHVE